MKNNKQTQDDDGGSRDTARSQEISDMSAVAAIKFDASIMARDRVGLSVADKAATEIAKISPAPSPALTRQTNMRGTVLTPKDRNWPAASRTSAARAR